MHNTPEQIIQYERRNNNFERWKRFVYDGDCSIVRQAMLDILHGKAVIEKMRGYNVYKTRVGDLRILFVDLGEKCFAFLLKLERHRYESLPFKKNKMYLNAALRRLNLLASLQDDSCYEDNFELTSSLQDEKFYYFNRSIIIPTEQQIHTLNLPTPLVVTGGAGTGKTMMAIVWIKRWMEESPSQPILYVCPNIELAHIIQQELYSHNLSTNQVHCLTYTDLVTQYDSRVTNLMRVDYTEFAEWFPQYLKTQRRNKKNNIQLNNDSLQAVYEVFREIATSSKRNSRSRSSILFEHTSELYTIFDAYTSFLFKTNKYDIALHDAQFTPQYFGCIADEAQQFTPIQWQLLCKLVTPTSTGLKIIFVGDSQNQRLFDQQCLLTEKVTRLNAICETTHIYLDASYRIPKNIQVFNNNLVQLKKSEHRDLKTHMVSDESLIDGVVNIVEFNQETKEICANMVLSPKCFVITTEKSRNRAAARFGEAALIFTIDEVGGQECECAIIFELFGQDYDDILLMSVPKRTTLNSLTFTDQHPVLIKHGNTDYYIYGFNGQTWNMNKIDLSHLPGFMQLTFPAIGASPRYIIYDDTLKPIFDYLASVRKHLVQDDVQLLQIESYLSPVGKSKKLKDIKNSTINTWINSRIIACTRVLESILVIFPSQNRYPALYSVLRNEILMTNLEVQTNTANLLNLQQDWLETACDFIRSRNQVLEQKAKQIYGSIGLSGEQIEEKINEVLTIGSVVDAEQSEYITITERDELLSCLDSKTLDTFFQNHPIDILLRKIIQKSSESSVLEMLFSNTVYNKQVYWYFARNHEKFQEVETLYQSRKLYSLVMESRNALMAKLLIAYSQDNTTQYRNCYKQVKSTCSNFMRMIINKEVLSNSYVVDDSKQFNYIKFFNTHFTILVNNNFEEKFLDPIVSSVLLGETQLTINLMRQELDEVKMIIIMILSIALGNEKVVNRCIHNLHTAVCMSEEGHGYEYLPSLINIEMEIATEYQQDLICEILMNSIGDKNRSYLFMQALEINNSSILNWCVKYPLNIIELSDLGEENIQPYLIQHPDCQIEYDRYIASKKLIHNFSLENFRNYFDFLITHNQLSKITNLILVNQEEYINCFTVLLTKQKEFQSFLVDDLAQKNFVDSVLYKLSHVTLKINNKHLNTLGLSFVVEIGASWFFRIYLQYYLASFDSIDQLLDIDLGETIKPIDLILRSKNLNKIFCDYLYKKPSLLNKIERKYCSANNLLDLALSNSNLELLQLMIAYGSDIRDKKTKILSSQQLTTYKNFKNTHAKPMRNYLAYKQHGVDCSYSGVFDKVIYTSFDALREAILDNKYSAKYTDPVFTSIIAGNEIFIETFIQQNTIRPLLSTYFASYLAVVFEQYNIFKILSFGINIIKNSESLFFAIIKKDRQMIEIIIERPLDLNLLLLAQQNFLRSQKNTDWLQDLMASYPQIHEFIFNETLLTTLEIVLLRLQVSLSSMDDTEQQLQEVAALENLILTMSPQELSTPINAQINTERLPIHAVIECLSNTTLDMFLERNANDINARYQGTLPLVMVLQRHALIPLDIMASTLKNF